MTVIIIFEHFLLMRSRSRETNKGSRRYGGRQLRSEVSWVSERETEMERRPWLYGGYCVIKVAWNEVLHVGVIVTRQMMSILAILKLVSIYKIANTHNT